MPPLGDAGAAQSGTGAGAGAGVAGSDLIHGANAPPALGAIFAWPISMAAPVSERPRDDRRSHPSQRTAGPGLGRAQDLPRRPPDRRGGDATPVLAEGPEQRAVADGIDQPGDAAEARCTARAAASLRIFSFAPATSRRCAM